MKNSILRLFRKILPFGLVSALLWVPLAAAQTSTPLTLKITPEVAEPGVPRTLTLSGGWPFGCSFPTAFSVLPSPYPSATNDLTLVTTGIVFPSPCAMPGLPVSVSTTYTPPSAGVQTLTVTHERNLVAQARLVTRAATGARAAQDLTGAWYDPAASGSGLSLFHAQAGSDLAAGALFLFDATGKPHWLLLNGLRWTDASRFTADLQNVSSASAPACTLLPGCARNQSGASQVGRVNVEMQAGGKLRLALTAGPPFADPPFPVVLTLERLSF